MVQNISKEQEFRVFASDTLSDECPMKTGVPQRSITGSILIIFCKFEPHYALESLGFFHHYYAHVTQTYFTFEVIAEAEHKLDRVEFLI